IDQMLDEANNFHPNIKLVRQIGRSVPFLDVLIENRKGTLTASVYHKEAAEPYVVPFGSDHPGHVFRNTVDTAIARAVRYSTTLFEFEEEIRQMKLMFLYNGQSFECSTISHHPLIDSIQNLTVQEGLKKQFKEVAIQSRIALFNMYLKSAEDQREEYKKKHEANVKKMDASQHTLNKNEKLSSTFVQLINERCNNISERIR
ncbi:unnamed protein product, partial [Rotaria socialis]